jgi:hypothetical protein
MNGTNKMFKPFGLLVGREERQTAEGRKQRAEARARTRTECRQYKAESSSQGVKSTVGGQ